MLASDALWSCWKLLESAPFEQYSLTNFSRSIAFWCHLNRLLSFLYIGQLLLWPARVSTGRIMTFCIEIISILPIPSCSRSLLCFYKQSNTSDVESCVWWSRLLGCKPTIEVNDMSPKCFTRNYVSPKRVCRLWGFNYSCAPGKGFSYWRMTYFKFCKIVNVF